MPPLQPHEPRIRYRPGEKVYCANQAAEDALGSGWSRYPQPAQVAEEEPATENDAQQDPATENDAGIVINAEPDMAALAVTLTPTQQEATTPVTSPKRKRVRPRRAR